MSLSVRIPKAGEESASGIILVDSSLQDTGDYQVSLTRLLDLTQSEDDEDKPSAHAFATAQNLITGSHPLLKIGFPRAIVSADGEGGIRIEWALGQREVRLIIPADEHGKAYIYHQQGTNPGVDSNPPTADTLAGWLTWLASGD